MTRMLRSFFDYVKVGLYTLLLIPFVVAAIVAGVFAFVFLAPKIPRLLNPSYPFPRGTQIEAYWTEDVGLDYIFCYRIKVSDANKSELYKQGTHWRRSTLPFGAWTTERAQIDASLGAARILMGDAISRGSSAPFERCGGSSPDRVTGLAWTGPAVENGTPDDVIILELDTGSIIYAHVHF